MGKLFLLIGGQHDPPQISQKTMIMFCESCKRAKKSEWMHNEALCLDCLYSKSKFKGKAKKLFKKENGIKREGPARVVRDNPDHHDEIEGPDPDTQPSQLKLF